MTNVSGNSDERLRDNRMFVRQRRETVADAMEFLSFLQNFSRRQGIPDFLKA